jgi:hypothetical protein
MCRWQQLLAEWSASEVDTWETQRLTEPSTLTAQHSRMSSAPGLNLARLASQGEEHHQHHGHAQQQKQDAAAGAAGGSVQVPEGGLRYSQPPEGDLAGAQQQQEQLAQGQLEQQQLAQGQLEQVTFARLARAHDLSPRKIPSAAAPHQAAESAAVAGEDGGVSWQGAGTYTDHCRTEGAGCKL